ncbi:zinc finger protein 835-like [Phlebotomus argentipes]|uniref:zinc finger protein 835-like n=1 Tax=Phlebotomus argentipes TaxID=94469 RepID=UPI002892B90B|nr:zinc finger protein 835-like [Phlebotomus argentipes]
MANADSLFQTGKNAKNLEPIELDFNSMCRLCGNVNINSFSVFTKDGNEIEERQKIEDYLNISISLEDELPKKLCIHCCNTLSSWHKFYESCHEMNVKFSHMVNQTKNEDPPEVPEEEEVPAVEEEMEEEDMEEHIEYLRDENEEDEGENLDMIEVVKEDIEETHEDARYVLAMSSSLCFEDLHARDDEEYQAFEYEVVVGSEQEEEQAPKDAEVRKSSTLTRRCGIFICPKCNASFTKRKDFKTHLLRLHKFGDDVKELMGARPKVDSEVLMRCRVAVNGQIQYRCEECGQTVKHLDSFIWHWQIHTGLRLFKCHLCDKSFRIRQGLNCHIREVHLKTKNYQCDSCDRLFANYYTLVEHRRTHTGERPHKCEICAKTFRQKAALYVHRKMHSVKREFACDTCDHSFVSLSALHTHEKTHTDEKAYECDTCHWKFRTKFDLKRHWSVHSDEKPFECAECSKTFRVKRYLKRHMDAKHPPKRRRLRRKKARRRVRKPCRFCSQTFKDEALLRNHTEVEHIDRVFLCDLCQGYVDREELMQHMITHISATEQPEKPPANPQETEKDERGKCPICSKLFRSRSGFKYHLEQFHDKIKDKKCQICGKLFGCVSTLNNHVKHIHGMKRNYCCRECSRSFKSLSSLYIHNKVVHENVKRFSCKLCYKGFVFKQQLQDHLMTHTKEKLFSCDICRKRFGFKTNLKKHLKTHESGYFKCHICSFNTTQKRYLAHHMKRNHLTSLTRS